MSWIIEVTVSSLTSSY